jgi:hypothetical protein
LNISIYNTTTSPYSPQTLTASTTGNTGQQSGALPGPLAALNLTPAQSAQLQTIFQNAQSQNLSFSQVQSQVNSVLTPTQQATLQTDALKGGHKHHHHGGGGGGSSTSSIDSGTDAFGVPAGTSSSTSSTSMNGALADFLDGATGNSSSSSSLFSQISNPFSNIAATIAAQAQFQPIPS